MANELAKLYVTIGADIKDFARGITTVKSDMSSLEKTTAALGKTAVAAFAVATTAVVGFTAAVAKSVNAAADMEQQVADIRSIFGKTAPAVEELNDLILELGLDPKLKVSATEAADAVEMLAKNGVDMANIMGGAARSAILLANSTTDNFALSADVATDVMQQFNISAGEMGAAVDGIIGVTQASKFSIDDYALAIAQAGGVAGALGVTFDDFNATIAATSSSFGSGSDAGTSFKVFLQRLTPDTNNARDAMRDLGLMTEAGSSKFYDAAGNMRSMEEIAGLLQGAFGGLSDAQRNSAASTIFGTDAMRTALALADAGTATIAKYKMTIGNTSAEEAAATRMDTFRGSLEIARGIIEALTISIGQKFIPVLRPMVDLFSALAQQYGPRVVEWFGGIAESLGGLIERFAKFTESVRRGVMAFEDGSGILSNFLELIGVSEKRSTEWALKLLDFRDIVTGLWDSFIKLIDSVTATFMPVTNAVMKFMGFKDVLTATGVLLSGPILTALGALVAALWPIISTMAAVTAAVAALRWAWQNDFMGIQTFTRNWLNKITNWFYNESGIWQGSWEETLDYLSWWASYGWKEDVYWPLRTWLLEMRADIHIFALGVVRRFEEWSRETKHVFSGWIGDTKHFFLSWRDRIVATFEDFTGPIIKEIDDWSRVTLSTLERWRDWGLRYIREWKEDIVERFQAVFEWWDTHIQPFINYGRDIVQGLWDGVKEKWTRFTDWWGDRWEELKRRFKNFFGIHSPSTLFAEFGSSMMDGLAMGIDAASGKVYSALDGVSNNIGKTMAGLTANVGQTGTVPGMAALHKYASFEDALGGNVAGGVFEAIRHFATAADEAMKKYGITDTSLLKKTQPLIDLAKLGNSASVGALKDGIDGVIGQLLQTGVASNFGADARSGLSELSHYFDVLMRGGVYTGNDTWLQDSMTVEPPSGGSSATDEMANLLRAILEALRQNGAIDANGYQLLATALGGRGNPYGNLVANTAGLAR